MPRALARVVATGCAVALIVLPSPARASNDPRSAEQWALGKIKAEAAWARSTGQGVRIGIVDTGVDLAHEDLAGKVAAHTSCIGSGGDPAKCLGSGQDDQGHGTHVSGIAAAVRDNAKGVAGVAPDAQLVVAKVLDAEGSGADADVTAGIKWVVDHGAKVVNLSLGDPAFVITSLFGTGLRDGIDYAWAHGAVPVLAAGNVNLLGLGIGSSDYGALPALVVGATDREDRVSGYSSPLGTAVWGLLAPGGAGTDVEADDILSTIWKEDEPNAYEFLAGTSMAAPHVSGAVALLLSQGLSPQAAVARLLATVDTSVACGPNSPNCRGRLDLARAVTGGTVPLPGPVPAPGPAPSPGGLLPSLSGLLDLLSILPLGTSPAAPAAVGAAAVPVARAAPAAAAPAARTPAAPAAPAPPPALPAGDSPGVDHVAAPASPPPVTGTLLAGGRPAGAARSAPAPVPSPSSPAGLAFVSALLLAAAALGTRQVVLKPAKARS